MRVAVQGEGTPQAYVDNGSGQRLFIGCRPRDGTYDRGLRLYSSDFGAAADRLLGGAALVAQTGAEGPFDHGPASAAQRTFAIATPEEVVAAMINEASLSLTVAGIDVGAFTLMGFAAAMDIACPAP